MSSYVWAGSRPDFSVHPGRPLGAIDDRFAQYTQLRSERLRENHGASKLTFATPPSWISKPLCAGRWAEFDRNVTAKKAAALCAGCPLAARCLDEALAEENGVVAHVRFGTRGGLNPEGRHQEHLRRERQQLSLVG